ncbi:B12-binding domain-containing radical SAM protein [Desulfoplanes sp. PS50]
MNKVLLLYTDPYYLVKQVYPFGLDLIASTLRSHGYQVELDYPFLPGPDVGTNLYDIVTRFRPDCIGLGIRNIDTTMACEAYGNFQGPGFSARYFLPEIKTICSWLGDNLPGVPVIAGGGGFTISPEAMLEELGLDFGIQGEGERAFLQFLECWPDKERVKSIPGLVWRDAGGGSTPRIPHVFDASYPRAREPKFRYALEYAALPVQLKRGCNQGCSFCVEPLLEGRRFVHRPIPEVVDELGRLAENYPDVRKIFFIDTEFNIPNLEYPQALIEAILAAGLHDQFRFASQFLPRPFTREFALLLKQAAFSLVFTCDSFADTILDRNGMSYRQKDILEALAICEDLELDHTVDLIFGLPGESHETLEETLSLMRNHPPFAWRRYEYTIGARIYEGTPLHRMIQAREDTTHVYGRMTPGMLEPCFYCSPRPPLELKRDIDAVLPFALEFKNGSDAASRQRLGVCWLADQCRWDETAQSFFELDLASQVTVYGYVFKSLVLADQIDMARSLLEYVWQEMNEQGGFDQEMGMVGHYLGLLK